MTTLSPSRICWPLSSVSRVAVRRKWAKAGNIRSDSSTAPGISAGSSSSSWRLLGVLDQRAHAAAVGRLGAVVAGGDEQEEAHDDLVLLELLAVDLGVDEHAGEVVGRVLAARGDQLAAALEDLGHVALHHRLDALGVEVGVAGAEGRVHQPRPDLVVLRRDAHEAADHARDDRLGDVGDEVAGLAALEAVEHAAVISRISSSCSAIRFGVKPRWKSALRRSCFGGSMPMNIAWSARAG